MSHRYKLTDAQRGLIEPLFPHHCFMGRPTREHTGAPWRDLSERFGPWYSVYTTFRRWQRSGRIDVNLEKLQLQLNEEGVPALC